MRLRAISALFATSALTIAGQAHAQAPAAESEAEGGKDTIVVTGTRIVRDGYEAPTPVTVATTEDLVKSTPTNLPDALNKLPQFQNSLSPGRSANNFSNFPIHGNILNLRGLGTPTNNPKGPLRTLIMMDGIRVAPTTFIGTIDTNVIPDLLVQRVDVVTGGASAAYGSDAVAGVVNFILDKKFTGLKGVAQYGISSRGDAKNYKLGAAFGAKFGGDRGHVLVSAEYQKSDGLRRNQRDIGTGGYSFLGSTVGCVNPSPATDPNACSPGGTLNPYKIFANTRISAASEFGRLYVGGAAGSVVTSTGALIPFDPGTVTGTPGVTSGGNGYRIPDRTTTIAPFKSLNLFGRLSYDLADNVEFYAQGMWSRTDLNYDALANSFVLANPTITLFKGNPLVPAAVDALIPAGGSIGFNAYWADRQATTVAERTTFWQATTGLSADFGNGWKASLSYTHGQSRHNMAQSGLFDWKKTLAAVDVVLVGTTPTCRVLTDPTVAAQYAGCQPLNLFSGYPQDSSPAGYAYATGASTYSAMFKHDSIVATISGSPFELPAGPVDITIGGEYRKQTLDLTSNADPATLPVANANSAAITATRAAYFAGLRGVPGGAQYFWLTNVGIAKGSLDVKEFFGEVAVPLLKDKPGFQDLSLNGAIRVTDYSFSGTVTTWKLGATWRVADELLFRSSYSRDIRAPNLYELFRGDTSGIGIALDPVCVDQQARNPVTPAPNCNQNIPTLSGGNPNLKPEVAKTLTFGVVLTPRGIPGLSASIDYYRIRMTGAIDSLSSQQILNNCFNFGASTPECQLITRPTATGFPTLIRVSEANISFLRTSGIDFDLSYRTRTGSDSSLAVRLYANYLDQFDTQLFAGQPIINYAGANVVGSNPVAYPHWRGSLSVDFNTGPFGVTVTEQFIGGMGRFLNAGNATPAGSNFIGGRVGGVAYTDLNLRYKIPVASGNVEVFATANNLFDKKPPLIPGFTPGVNLPTNISTYDVIGLAFTGGVRFKF